MVDNQLVKRIRQHFRLNEYETKVWLALLSRGIASAGEIATISGVPRSRTYDVLESLEKSGFAITKIGKPVKYIAVKPEEVIEKMKMSALQEAQERVKMLSSLKETSDYLELLNLYKNGIEPVKTHEITGTLKGRSNILPKIRELVQNAKREVFICTTLEDFEDKLRSILIGTKELDKSKVRTCFVVNGPVERLKKMKFKMKLPLMRTTQNARVYIVDREEVLFMITPQNGAEEVAIWLRSPYFASSLAALLEANAQKL